MNNFVIASKSIYYQKTLFTFLLHDIYYFGWFFGFKIWEKKVQKTTNILGDIS
jgi:hypothetical protein